VSSLRAAHSNPGQCCRRRARHPRCHGVLAVRPAVRPGWRRRVMRQHGADTAPQHDGIVEHAGIFMDPLPTFELQTSMSRGAFRSYRRGNPGRSELIGATNPPAKGLRRVQCKEKRPKPNLMIARQRYRLQGSQHTKKRARTSSCSNALIGIAGADVTLLQRTIRSCWYDCAQRR